MVDWKKLEIIFEKCYLAELIKDQIDLLPVSHFSISVKKEIQRFEQLEI